MKHLLLQVNLFAFVVALTLCVPVAVNAQEHFPAPEIKAYNFTSFAEETINDIEEWEAITPDSLKTHPEYGILPYNAPCSDCVEILSARTANTRQFIRTGSNGRKFLNTASYTDLHFHDAEGTILSFDPRLNKTDVEGVFQSRRQPNTTILDIPGGYSGITLIDGQIFTFNQQISTYYFNEGGAPESSLDINRTNYTVGDDGAYIKDAFEGIDQVLVYERSRVKSDYLIQRAEVIKPDYDYFVVQDFFELPVGYTLTPDQYEGFYNEHDWWYGELILENAEGYEMGRIMRPALFDSDTSDAAVSPPQSSIIGYEVRQIGRQVFLKMIIDADWLRDSNRVFPIHIDPTVFGTTATWTGAAGSDDSPNWCTQILSVPTPANATLTGSNIHWEYRALGGGGSCGATGCKIKHLQARICTTCDCSPSPAGVWVGVFNGGGLWIPTIDDGTTADLVECFTPQCASFNIDFTIYFNQFSCVTAGTCVNTCSYLEKFQVTIEGETVNVTGLAAGAAAYTVLDCTLQSGWLTTSTPNYGVPPYTYTWSPGGYTTSPVYVTFPLGTTTYTVTITDACGNTVSDNVTVINNCITLPIELVSFSGYAGDGFNTLQWEIDPAEKNKQFFIERSVNGRDFITVGQVDATGTDQTQFIFTDDQINAAVNYYRLRQVDDNGESLYSNMISIQSTGITDALVINQYDANTGNLALTVFTPSNGPVTLSVYDLQGKLVAANAFEVNAGATSVQVQLPALAAGTYLLSLRGTNLEASARLVH